MRKWVNLRSTFDEPNHSSRPMQVTFCQYSCLKILDKIFDQEILNIFLQRKEKALEYKYCEILHPARTPGLAFLGLLSAIWLNSLETWYLYLLILLAGYLKHPQIAVDAISIWYVLHIQWIFWCNVNIFYIVYILMGEFSNNFLQYEFNVMWFMCSSQVMWF